MSLRTDPNVYSDESSFVQAVLDLVNFVCQENAEQEYDDPDLRDARDRLQQLINAESGMGFDVALAKELADKLYTEYDRQDVPYLWEV